MQSIVDEVREEMKAAMKAKEMAKLNTIRLMHSSFSNAAIDLKTDKLTDHDLLTQYSMNTVYCTVQYVTCGVVFGTGTFCIRHSTLYYRGFNNSWPHFCNEKILYKFLSVSDVHKCSGKLTASSRPPTF
jgi:Yqey-like protein